MAYKIGTRVMDIEGEMYTVIEYKDGTYVLEDILGDRDEGIQEHEIVLYDSAHSKTLQEGSDMITSLEEKAMDVMQVLSTLFEVLKGKES